jgi:hypothetical protein
MRYWLHFSAYETKIELKYDSLQVYQQWCAQLTKEKSLAIKEGTHMADYNYETMRFLLSHEYPEGGGRPTPKMVSPLGLGISNI